MNLFFKSYRYCLIFFLLVAWESGSVSGISQEIQILAHPWIQEVNLPPSLNQVPNETFFQNWQGTLFIGKTNGLTILYGSGFQHINLPGTVFVSGKNSDTLCYVCLNDLGFLIKADGGTYKAESRAHLLPVSKRHFEPRSIHKTLDTIYISTDQGTYGMRNASFFYLDSAQFNAVKPLSGNEKEQALRIMEERVGIPETAIRQIVRGKNDELWILSEYALHHLLMPSPVQILEPNREFMGRMNFTTLLDRTLIAGSSKGLFRLEQDSTNQGLWNVSSFNGEYDGAIHLWSTYKGAFFAAGSGELYVIRENNIELIDRGIFTGIGAIDHSRVIASGPEGSSIYSFSDGRWSKSPLEPEMKNCKSFTCHMNKVFFTDNHHIYSLDPYTDKVKQIPHESSSDVMSLIMRGDELILQEGKKASIFDPGNNEFRAIKGKNHSQILATTRQLVLDTTDLCWILGGQGNQQIRLWTCQNPEEGGSIQEPFPLLKELDPFIGMELHDGNLYLTATDKIVILDLALLVELQQTLPLVVEETNRNQEQLSFHIGGLEFQQEPEPLYRERLLPHQNVWSAWHTNREVHLSRPRPGTYTLEVEMKDLYGRIGGPESLEINLPRPFYFLWYAWIFYALIMSIALFLFRKWWMLGYQRAETRISERMELRISKLTREKEQSDQLVAEMLPEDTAKQIKNKGKAKWDKYERATVLFSDIQGFTKIAEEMHPEALIDELDKFFFHFDSVVDKYNIEKIKTIGDAYMAAGGIPHKNSTNPVEVVLAALEMQAYMQQLKAARTDIWDLRIGIHTGPVIAGVVGHKKISYDIWGDTVNTASRMESSGIPGKVNISGITYGMVKEYFICEYRGKLPVKYKGNIDMYFVTGLRPELAVDLKGIPNKRFHIKLQLLRMADLEEEVFGSILVDLPETLGFHTAEYARKVYNQSFLLCRAEEIEQGDRLLIRTAAMMLFTGLTQSYHNFENRSAVISREILPAYSYSESQIDQICNLIMATKMPFNPINPREKVLIDTRMEYIGRPEYKNLIKLLYQELKEAGVKMNGQQFKNQQLELLFNFNFFTQAAQRLREVPGKDQMVRLEEDRWI